MSADAVLVAASCLTLAVSLFRLGTETGVLKQKVDTMSKSLEDCIRQVNRVRDAVGLKSD